MSILRSCELNRLPISNVVGSQSTGRLGTFPSYVPLLSCVVVEVEIGASVGRGTTGLPFTTTGSFGVLLGISDGEISE